MMRRLAFRGSGHDTGIADGEAVAVFDWDGNPGTLPSREATQPRLWGPWVPGLRSDRCGACDAWLELTADDAEVTAAGPCPYPDGITTVITLAVPSGKLVVTDDLRPAYDWRAGGQDPPGMAGYGSALGQHQAIMAMAAAGCAYGPVLNTSPGLFRTGGDCYVIATPGFDLSSEEDLVPAGWQELATVWTDLWAYSIADYEDWQSRDWNRGDRARRGKQDTVVSITPGTYQFTHHTGERGFRYPHDTEEAVIFAHVERKE